MHLPTHLIDARTLQRVSTLQVRTQSESIDTHTVLAAERQARDWARSNGYEVAGHIVAGDQCRVWVNKLSKRRLKLLTEMLETNNRILTKQGQHHDHATH